MPKIQDFRKLGQSIWYDYLRRSFITSGELKALIDEGLVGVTSNPSIFEKAIAGSTDYDEDLQRLVREGKSPTEILETLMLEDLAQTADLFLPIYKKLNGADGYASIEVNPLMAQDSEEMIAEGKRFFQALNRPNVMIKIPATPAGFPVIDELISEGINVNVTLIFSRTQYRAAAEAYLSGLEKLLSKGGDLSKVSSVASFFVSRVDTAVDRELDKVANKELQGKIAIANAKLAYADFKELFKGPRWERLRSKGARIQRVLWASTSTKNPHYPDTLYVDSLIGPETINTVPPATLRAVLDHGIMAQTIDTGLDSARAQIKQLQALGINLEAITNQLEDEGIASFSKAFDTLVDTIVQKRDRLEAEWHHESANLGAYQNKVDASLASISEKRIIHRIWRHDYTVWKPDPTEISNRLGWLHTAEIMLENLHRIDGLVKVAQAAGYKHAYLLGMGGSSLAPKVFIKTFGAHDGYLDLTVIDSTDPDFILEQSKRVDPVKALFIVSTKSGTTVETLSFFKFFYNQVASAVGKEKAGEHFVAITDPGTELATLAEQYHFRATFLNDPNIGGRYSALSFFGLVPAALIGMDVARLLNQATTVACSCETCVDSKENPGAWLGAILGELAKAGRDKVTFVASDKIASFADWVEQLIAESTGKDGRGILPIVGEPLGPPEVYGNDRVFVYLQLEGDIVQDAELSALERAGHPVVRTRVLDLYDLGRQFFLWEMAIAIAGYVIGINPFDQPNVEMAKESARQMVAEYTEKGALPSEKPSLESDGVSVYGTINAKTAGDALTRFLEQVGQGAYVALQAYVHPTVETYAALQELRVRLRGRTKLATTVGYGPSFLHSTGQLHKGDAGHGLFLQFTSEHRQDAPIPDEPGSSSGAVSFGTLEAAQALGDREALLSRGRKVIKFHFSRDVVEGLNRLSEAVA